MKALKMIMSLCLVFVFCGCQKNEKDDASFESVSITVTIVDQMTETELFQGEIHAEGSELTLEDVLLANAETLQLISEDGTYGLQINGLMGVETTDWNAGPWWMYSSENNESCVKAGYCDGASNLKVADGDEFTFTFSTGY